MRARFLAVPLLMILLGMAAYGPALSNPLLFDDKALLQGNANLTLSRASSLVTPEYFDFFPGEKVSYRPLSVLSYLVNHALWGEDYRAWRTVYLAWHIVNALLLSALFFVLTGAAGASFLGGAVFLLHPVHSEVINQVSFNEEIMMTGFLLAASLAMAARKRGGRWYTGWAVVAGYALALLCKETAILFPLVILVWALSKRDKGEASRERGSSHGLLLSLAATGGLYLLLRFGLMKNPVDSRAMVFSAADFGAEAARGFQILFSYVRRFIWPFDLSPTYNFPAPRWTDPDVLGGAVILLALGGLMYTGIRRSRFSLAVPAVWFLTGLIPLGYNLFYPKQALAYDRYLYYPSIGLLGYCFVVLGTLCRKIPLRRSAGVAVASLVATLCLALFLAAVTQRNRAWSNALALWTGAVERSPSSPMAHYQRGNALWKAGMPEESAEEYRKAVMLDGGHLDAYNNLANVYGFMGEHAKAGEAYRRVLKMSPNHLPALYNLGNLYLAEGRYREAEGLYRRLLAGDDSIAMAWNQLGIVNLARGRCREAVASFRRALRLDPALSEAGSRLSQALASCGEGADLESGGIDLTEREK